MAYESPAQIRNRQNRADAAAQRPRVKRSLKVRVPSAERRAEFLAFHSGAVALAIESGDFLKAGRHAQTLAHGVMQWRALEIQAATNCIYYKACQIARFEIYGDLSVDEVDRPLPRRALVAIGQLAFAVLDQIEAEESEARMKEAA